MKFNLKALILLSLVTLPSFFHVASAENTPEEARSFQEFLTYPHVEKGLSAIANHDYGRAVAEFKQARSWSTERPETALYLANAYNLDGQYQNAVEVLEAQLIYTPKNATVISALGNNRKAYDLQLLEKGRALENNISELQTYLADNKPFFFDAYDEHGWVDLLAKAFAKEPERILSFTPHFATNQAYQDQIVLEAALTSGNQVFASAYIKELASKLNKDPQLVEFLSYQLAKDGGTAQAIQILMQAYPFVDASPQLQKKLVLRLATMIEQNPKLVSTTELGILAKPMNSFDLRGIQANLFAALKNCSVVRSLLSDFSIPHSETEWRLLGQCYQVNQPGLAEYAYQKAMAMNPNIVNTRAYAYQAFAVKNYSQSLSAWRSMDIKEMSNQDLESAALTAISAQEPQYALDYLAQLDQRSAPKDALYWWLEAQLELKEYPSIAAEDLKKAIALAPTVAYYNQLASIQQELNQTTEATSSLETALKLDPSNTNTQASLAYAYYQNGQMAQARTLFLSANQAQPDDSRTIKQLAYTDQKLGLNEEALKYTELAIDDYHLQAPDDLTAENQNQLFGLQRMHEDLTRRWTFSVDATGGNQVTTVPNSGQPGLTSRSYSQAEAAYRLGDPAIDDGKTFSAYSRVFAGSGTLNTALPLYAPMAAAGFRWKPIGSQNINLAVEEQTPLDHVAGNQTQAMLRASASFLNSGAYSDDWHPTGPGWVAQNLYLDAAHYMTSGLTSLTSDYRISYHDKIVIGQTIEPYTHLQLNTLNNQVNHDLRVGLGVRWNYWSGNTQYNAYPSKVYIGLEAQHAFTTYLNEKNVIFLSLGGRW
jgi:adsorption protein A